MKNNKTITLILTIISCLLLGAFIGGSTNAINGIVSPTYFINTLGWEAHNNIRVMSIFQGVFEGLLYGFIFAIVYATVASFKIVGSVKNIILFKFFISLGATILVFWAVGGIIAILLAYFGPEFYQSTFVAAPKETEAMLRYAWVGGSIWGGLLGGLLSLVVGASIFKQKICG